MRSDNLHSIIPRSSCNSSIVKMGIEIRGETGKGLPRPHPWRSVGRLVNLRVHEKQQKVVQGPGH